MENKFININGLKKSTKLIGDASLDIYSIETNVEYADFAEIRAKACVPIFQMGKIHIPAKRLNISYGEDYNAPTVVNTHEPMPEIVKIFYDRVCAFFPGDVFTSMHVQLL